MFYIYFTNESRASNMHILYIVGENRDTHLYEKERVVRAVNFIQYKLVFVCVCVVHHAWNTIWLPTKLQWFV